MGEAVEYVGKHRGCSIFEGSQGVGAVKTCLGYSTSNMSYVTTA